MPKLTCNVSFERNGRLGAHVTTAETLFEEVRIAYRFFQAEYWQGPRPTLDTEFKVLVTSKDRPFCVYPRRAFEEEQRGQKSLF